MTGPHSIHAGAEVKMTDNEPINPPVERPLKTFMAPADAPYAHQHGTSTTALFAKIIDDWTKSHPDRPFPRIPTIVIEPKPPTNVEAILEMAKDGRPVALNAGLTFFGTRTLTRSTVGFLNTQDTTAKTLYALGIIFF